MDEDIHTSDVELDSEAEDADTELGVWLHHLQVRREHKDTGRCVKRTSGTTGSPLGRKYFFCHGNCQNSLIFNVEEIL